MSTRIFVDGIETDRIHVLDRGLQFGDGLFETMAVVQRRIRLLDRHLDRLCAGCRHLGLPLLATADLQTELEQIASEQIDGAIKLIVTRGSGPRGYAPPLRPVARRIVIAGDVPAFPDRMRLGFCGTRLATGGSLAGIKHLNRLEQVIAMRELQDATDLDEGLMLDCDGRVVEAVSANVFIVRGRRIVTPRLHRCGVAGVMRGLVLELAHEAGYAGGEADLMPDDVAAADEIFLTSSLTGIRPVIALAGQPRREGPVTADLKARLHERLSGEPV